MGIQCEWTDDTQSVLIWHFDPRWSTEDIRRCKADVREHLAVTQRRVDFILDYTEGGLLPVDFVQFIKQRDDERSPLEGTIVALGVDGLLRTLWRYLSEYLPPDCQVQFADSQAEALALIEAERKQAV